MIDNKHKYLPYDEDFMECHPKKDGKDKKEEKSIVINNKNNIDCPLLDKQVNSIIRRCPPTELVKNGGFEQTGVFQTFAGWDETTTNYTIRSFEKPYEGFVCAEFISRQTTVPITKTATLSQEISVTPGCFLVLSFAENFRRAAEGGFDGLNIRASVFYEEAGFSRGKCFDSISLISIVRSFSATEIGRYITSSRQGLNEPSFMYRKSSSLSVYFNFSSLHPKSASNWSYVSKCQLARIILI
jgi:hypothetical protein